MHGRVLIVAGSDSGGGAGIQADLKTVTALGAYGATAITALTAQDTEKVWSVREVEPDFVAEQMRVVLGDIGADCVKTGMLHRSEVIEAVVSVLAELAPDVPLVVDPVMTAKGGSTLLDLQARQTLRARLVPMATVLTPNIPEAQVLLGHPISAQDDLERIAAEILGLGCRAVYLKGGHLPGESVCDLLLGEGILEWFAGMRIPTRHTHGTGCTLASALAAGLAQGLPLEAAAHRAWNYVREAIRSAPGFGRAHGPLNHAHTLRNGDC